MRRTMRPRETTRGPIPSLEIRRAYQDAFKAPGFWGQIKRAILGQTCPFQFADAFYKQADEALIEAMLFKDTTDLVKYVAEDFDCDDFAFRLMGVFHQDSRTAAMPIFITWVQRVDMAHAILSYYTKGEVRLIEPQNDVIFNVPEDWELLLLVG